ncbi:hypothetical protein ASF43_28440 [Pseudorhodoferax sp. Leaf267]|nr:hypothetical protein ASF43_28440 [Pseudorhodoferax sp. Leaf267]
MAVSVGAGVTEGAQVCVDVNGNGACDQGEPQATSANGGASLNVPTADVGKYAVVVTQADGVVYRAPAGATDVVGPYSTMVFDQMRATGATLAEATAALQSQSGLSVSPLARHAAGTDAGSATAALAGRIMAAALKMQLDALLPLAGQKDSGGVDMTAAAIRDTVTGRLTTMAAGATDAAARALAAGTCTDATSAGCNAAVQAAATAAVAAHPLKAATLPDYAQAQRLLAAAQTATGPNEQIQGTFSLDFVNPGDADNWFYRVLLTTTAGAVPDANGMFTASDLRVRSVGGVQTTTSWTNDPARQGDLHWSGSAWEGCAVGSPIKSTPRDAGGVNRSDACGSLNVNAIRQVRQDISGQSMQAVVDRLAVARPGWGVPVAGLGASSALAGAVFPAGSQLLHRWATDVSLATTYDVRSSNEVTVPLAITAAGGDARGGATPACAVTANQAFSPADTLETLVARMRGTPCIFDQATQTVGGSTFTSASPNEWAGQSTASFGTLGSAAVGATPQTAYYTPNELIRVAFGDGNVARYYSCLQRWSDGSPRNCTAIGTGSYTITQLGDGRAMTFQGVPGQAARLGFERVFVERGGKVYFGFRNRTAANSYNPRLNSVAANALLTQYSIPAVVVP